MRITVLAIFASMLAGTALANTEVQPEPTSPIIETRLLFADNLCSQKVGGTVALHSTLIDDLHEWIESGEITEGDAIWAAYNGFPRNGEHVLISVVDGKPHLQEGRPNPAVQIAHVFCSSPYSREITPLRGTLEDSTNPWQGLDRKSRDLAWVTDVQALETCSEEYEGVPTSGEVFDAMNRISGGDYSRLPDMDVWVNRGTDDHPVLHLMPLRRMRIEDRHVMQIGESRSANGRVKGALMCRMRGPTGEVTILPVVQQP